MGIDFQKYRSWEGAHMKICQRVFAIVKRGVLLAFKSKWVIALIVLTYFFGVVTRLLSIVFTPSKFEPQFFQGFYTDGQLWFILLAAVVGSGLIATDFHDNSVILYFSRAVSKRGYIIGKFGVLMSVLGIVVLVPGILLFFVALLSSPEPWGQVLSYIWVLGSVIAMSVLILILLGIVSLALSSLTSDKRYAGAGIFIIFLFPSIIAGILKDILNDDRLLMVSIWNNVTVVGRRLFDIENPYSFPWYESLLVIFGVILCAIGIIYWTIFRKEVRI